MEMWLKRSTLVLLTVAAAVLVISGQTPVILDKTRRRVEAPFGSSLTFHCRLMTETHERFRVFWRFNPLGSSFNGSQIRTNEIFNRSAKTSTTVSNRTMPSTEDALLKYTLSNATDLDSGWYFCEVIVEIPLYTCITSNGTEVVITKSKEHTTYPSLPIVTATVSPIDNIPPIDWWLWIMMGVSAFILIVLLVICVLLRKRRRRSRGEDPVYANTRPVANKQPSPRPGMLGTDNLKMVSSSQNLRNPSPSRRCDDGKRRYK